MNAVKPGVQTSEFWTVWGGKVMALVVSLVAILGGKPEDQQALGQASNTAVVGLGAIVAFIVLAKSYVSSRTAVKLAATGK